MHSLVAGNWKMNGLAASLAELETLKAALAAAAPACEVKLRRQRTNGGTGVDGA